MADKDTAEGIVNGQFQIKRNAEGTAYDLTITTSNVVYGSYATKAEADAVVNSFKNTYIEEVEIAEATEEAEAVYAYNIWRKWSYLETATESAASDDNGAYSKFSDFKFSNITKRTTADPFVSYEQDQFQFLNYEDLGAAGYFYTGANDARKDAADFVSSYHGFAENDLSNAYHAWFMHSVESQLYNVGKLDTNNDGIVTATDITQKNADGTDATDANGNVIIANYADGTPGIPTAMYPFYTTSSTSYTYTDYYFGATGSGWANWSSEYGKSGPVRYTNTINMADINEANYDQLALALEMGADPRYDVEFSREEVETIVRLALSATPDFDCLQFDIIPDGTDADGNLIYNGQYQWEDLSTGHLNTIAAWLRSRNLEYKAIENSPYGAVDYAITRPRFAYIDASSAFVSGVSATPTTVENSASIRGNDNLLDSQITYTQEVTIQIQKSYCDYIKSLYDNREALYDNIDLISYRHEQAEINRSKAVDTTMLEWAKNTFQKAYMGNAGRNLKYDGVDSTGALKTTRLYTTTSYEKFRVAYDYVVSLIDAAANSLLASDELTQSMASEAFYGIIEAYYQLVPFTGPADWTQLEAYIDIAQSIIDDPLSYDANVGYNREDGQWDIMVNVLRDSNNLKADSTIDCERQSEVDDMAAALYQAIYKLNYLTSPDLKSNTDTTGNDLIGTVVTNPGTGRITGQIYGLEEGVGAVMELIQVVGMREDEASGTKVSITGSGRGVGTGAYFIGTVENRERFRYYAVVYGDINGDTRVDGTDVSVLEIALMTTSNEQLTVDDFGSAAKFEAADVNHDGFVDADDIDEIVNHYTFVSKINQKAHSSTTVVE